MENPLQKGTNAWRKEKPRGALNPDPTKNKLPRKTIING
jgi:hypothetical protein